MKQRLFLAGDVAAIDALAAVAARHGLTGIEIERDGCRVRLTREPAATARPGTADGGELQRAAGAGEPAGAVVSPMVGIAYLRSGPGADSFVEVGTAVKPGDRLLLIEALGTFNDIVAEFAGRVASILVTDGEPVEFGQPLMVVE